MPDKYCGGAFLCLFVLISCYRAELSECIWLLALGPHVWGYRYLEWCVIAFEEAVKEVMM